MRGIIGSLVVAVVLSLPLIPVVRSRRRLTWTGAIGLGTLISAISLILTAEIPSRILYLFDARHETWAGKASFLKFLKGPNYIYAADIVANTVQGAFFVILMVAAYYWGKKQREAGRFKS